MKEILVPMRVETSKSAAELVLNPGDGIEFSPVRVDIPELTSFLSVYGLEQ